MIISGTAQLLIGVRRRDSTDSCKDGSALLMAAAVARRPKGIAARGNLGNPELGQKYRAEERGDAAAGGGGGPAALLYAMGFAPPDRPTAATAPPPPSSSARPRAIRAHQAATIVDLTLPRLHAYTAHRSRWDRSSLPPSLPPSLTPPAAPLRPHRSEGEGRTKKMALVTAPRNAPRAAGGRARAQCSIAAQAGP